MCLDLLGARKTKENDSFETASDLGDTKCRSQKNKNKNKNKEKGKTVKPAVLNIKHQIIIDSWALKWRKPKCR